MDLYIFDVRKKEFKELKSKYIVIYNSIKKYKYLRDKKMSFVSSIYKKLNKNKYFSISHKYPYVIFALDSEKIGVDIEKKKRINNKMFKRFNVSKNEFYYFWTARESYYKIYQTFPSKINVKSKNICYANFFNFKNYLICICSNKKY